MTMEKAMAVYAVVFLITCGVTVFFAGKEKEAALNKTRQWVADASSKGCKVTGFVGDRLKPVWTCPNGNLYLQP